MLVEGGCTCYMHIQASSKELSLKFDMSHLLRMLMKCVPGVPRSAAQWRGGGSQSAAALCAGDCDSRPVLGQVPDCLTSLQPACSQLHH